MDKQIKEINKEIKTAIQRIENIWKKYDELREKYKAKEQECESWKALINEAQIEQRKLEEQLEAYKMEAEEGKEINAELKAENEELKKENERLKQPSLIIPPAPKMAVPTEKVKETVDSLLKVQYQLADSCKKYKQTLTEIKEIAEQIENNDLYVTVPAKARIGDKIKINLIGIQDILNIISEVEDVSSES